MRRRVEARAVGDEARDPEAVAVEGLLKEVCMELLEVVDVGDFECYAAKVGL